MGNASHVNVMELYPLKCTKSRSEITDLDKQNKAKQTIKSRYYLVIIITLCAVLAVTSILAVSYRVGYYHMPSMADIQEQGYINTFATYKNSLIIQFAI